MVRGFTLIELLIVISIIVLLIAILLPVLGNARATTQDVQCKSNIRQLMVAELAYTVDNNDWHTSPLEWVDTFRIVRDGVGSFAAGNNINPDPSDPAEVENGRLFPYLSTAEAYVCPVAAGIYDRNSQALVVGDRYVRTYSRNVYSGHTLAAAPYNYAKYEDIPRSEIKRTTSDIQMPSEYAVYLEENDFSIQGYGGASYNDGLLFARPFEYWRQDCIASFHNATGDLTDGQGHVAFADGHVSEARYDDPNNRSKYYGPSAPPFGLSAPSTVRLLLDFMPNDG